MNRPNPRPELGAIRTLLALALALATLAGCGGEQRDASEPGEPSSAQLRQELDNATSSSSTEFPAVRGRTLQEVANALDATGPEVGLATSVFLPGRNRLAFGMIDPKSGFVYGKTAVYVGKANGRAYGPYAAPADLLMTDGRFRSQTAASDSDPFAAIYSATVEFPRPGNFAVLAVTIIKGQFVAAGTSVKVRASNDDPVPAPGETPPEVKTDTVASAGGNIKSIDTRVPPDDMHEFSFDEAVGRKPVALLFSTPALCESRVCGPVVDIAQQLKSKYGDRMTFIHQEVYVDNDPSKGLRPPLRQFGLPTEPWLFTIDQAGRVAARLEGSFGFNAFDRAINAALDS